MSDLELDLDAALDDYFESKKEKPKLEFQYYYVNMLKIKEALTFRLIPDSNGKPLKVLHGIREGSIPIINEDGSTKYSRIRICNKSDFTKLTSAQITLIDELNKLLDQYCSKNPESWAFKPTKVTTLFFGVLLSLGNDKYEVLKTSLFLNTSANFAKYLSKFINDNITISSKSWVNEIFNRKEEFDSFIHLTHERIDYGYKFNFDLIKGQQITLNPEIFERANDLNQEYIDVLNFNEELYYEFMNNMKNYLNNNNK